MLATVSPSKVARVSARSEITTAKLQSHNALMNAIAASPDLEAAFIVRWR
jgi:hypothetical protein